MIFVTTYTVKPYLSKEETKELMGVFAEVGTVPGTTAHYTAADGSHGLVIAETDDPEALYANLVHYAPWIEFDATVMLPVEDAVPHILESIEPAIQAHSPPTGG